MAKDNWLTVSPMAGTGNASVSNSAPSFTGRVQRSTIVTGKAVGVAQNKTYTVIQKPIAEYVSVNTATWSVDKGENTVTITGFSNSPKLQFLIGSPSGIPVDLPTTYVADGKTTNNGSAIAGDPGSVARYSFTASVRIPANNVGRRQVQIIIRGSSSAFQATVLVTQATATFVVTYQGGDYVQSVLPTSQTVDYGSSASSVATLLPEDTNYRYEFDGWYEGSNKVSSDLQLAVSNIVSDRTFVARARRISKAVNITVQLEASSSGRGSVSGGGSYNIGSQCTVRCTMNNPDDIFDGWYEGSLKVSSDLNYTFTVAKARTLAAKILYLDVAPASLEFGATGGTETLTVSTNIDSWTVS